MKITKEYLLLYVIAFLTALFIAGEVLGYEAISRTARALIIPSATVVYFLKVKNKSFFFSGFLLLFSSSELMDLWVNSIPNLYMFFIGNILYILGYILLIIEVLGYIKQSPDYKNFFVKYALHLAILLMFAVYLVILLAEIERPYMDNWEYSLSMLYNSLILLLLTLATLNFICSDTQKSLILFLATLCIVFSEIVQVAYYYLAESYVLNIAYTVLLVLAFYLFFRQGVLKPSKNKDLNLFKT